MNLLSLEQRMKPYFSNGPHTTRLNFSAQCI
uniref:Uncharacterized protein n=1 Tax=Anguilla anguilla TaxID=7936 RepID=A0A0E9QVI9_ANGAN